MDRPSLSVAMIVGDENVDGLLALSIAQSLRVADEVVVCCSGCDGSAEVARQAGARVARQRWLSDFAWARNQALGMVSPGIDYILVVDADELIDDAFVDAWPTFHPTAQAYTLGTHHFVKPTGGTLGVHRDHGWYPDPHIRLFRNLPTIWYHGVIHEQPVGFASLEPTDWHIYHYGWARNEEFLLRKLGQRNIDERNARWSEGIHELATGPWADCQRFDGEQPKLFSLAALDAKESVR